MKPNFFSVRLDIPTLGWTKNSIEVMDYQK